MSKIAVLPLFALPLLLTACQQAPLITPPTGNAFQTQAITPNYVLRKFQRWGQNNDSTSTLKELRYGCYKHPTSMTTALNSNLSLRDQLLNMSTVQQAQSQDGTLANCLNTLRPATGEFRINTNTAHYQDAVSLSPTSTGQTVAVWRTYNGMSGVGLGIQAQRFDSQGQPVGTEISISTSTTDHSPQVAMNPSTGDFVVVWGRVNGNSRTDIWAKRYSNTGSVLTHEFMVDNTTTQGKADPDVAIASDGEFIVVWDEYDPALSYDVYAKAYQSNATAKGSRVRVNSFTNQMQYWPRIDVNANKQWAVVWASESQDGDSFGIYGRRIDSNAATVGSEFQVSQVTTGRQESPALQLDNNNTLTVTYETTQAGTYDVYARRIGSNNIPLGNEWRVHSNTVGEQRFPSISGDRQGLTAIVWRSPDSNGNGVFGHTYLNGVSTSPEFQLNIHTTSHQVLPAVCMNSSGQMLTAWESLNQDGSYGGIYGRRFSATGTGL